MRIDAVSIYQASEYQASNILINKVVKSTAVEEMYGGTRDYYKVGFGSSLVNSLVDSCSTNRWCDGSIIVASLSSQQMKK